MKIGLANINPVVGDFSGNLNLIIKSINEFHSDGADLVLLPELSLVGYPPQDLLLRPSMIEFAKKQLGELANIVSSLAKKRDFHVVVGTIAAAPKDSANPIVNAAVVLGKDGILATRAKSLIPHYDIFNERRYFASALELDTEWTAPVEISGTKVGILVCEDSWHDTVKYDRRLYDVNPTEKLVEAGCELLLNLSASPFQSGKKSLRRSLISGAAQTYGVPIAYVNQLGAQDEILFDGDSFIVDASGDIIGECESFSPSTVLVDVKPEKSESNVSASELEQEADVARTARFQLSAGDESVLREVHAALVTGIRDYAQKNGFSRALLGLSGGIDSAVVACLAADALGKENVLVFSMPSKFSSGHSIDDAEALARNNGIPYKNLSIKFLQSTIELNLKPFFEGTERGLAEENIQARLRGLALMGISNKFGHMLLATGNKSELAVGYSTLYGDMCGALAPIGDLYKTEVYALANYLNRDGERIPQNTIDKPPSAELRPDQKDEDSLPPYELLDRMLHCLVEEEHTVAETIASLKAEKVDVDEAILREVEQMLFRSEYKRKQFGPILRISQKAFGIGRRYPLSKRIPDFSS